MPPSPSPSPSPSLPSGIAHRRDEPDSLREWFEQFHAEQPHVYEAFKDMAREIREQGHKRYGAKTIMERLRWEHPVRHAGQDFKLSNTIKDRCSSRYARMLIAEDPTFSAFFALRPLLTDGQREDLSEVHRGR